MQAYRPPLPFQDFREGLTIWANILLENSYKGFLNKNLIDCTNGEIERMKEPYDVILSCCQVCVWPTETILNTHMLYHLALYMDRAL